MPLILATVFIFLMFMPSYSYAHASWTWIFSSDTCTYYLDKNNVYVDERGIYYYAIKQDFVDDSARKIHIDMLSHLDHDTDFSRFYTEITKYKSCNAIGRPQIFRQALRMYCYNRDGSFIRNFNGKTNVYRELKHGGIGEIIDLKARSFAIYRPSKNS